jgi:hypothetical protein
VRLRQILFQRRQSRQQRIERFWTSVHRALSTGLVRNFVTGSRTSIAAAETKFQLRRNSGRRESKMHGIVQTVKILFEILNEICFDFRRPVDESRRRRCEEFKIVITLRSARRSISGSSSLSSRLILRLLAAAAARKTNVK